MRVIARGLISGPEEWMLVHKHEAEEWLQSPSPQFEFEPKILSVDGGGLPTCSHIMSPAAQVPCTTTSI
eukprot:SAG11_NODE_4273_length_1973_cov_1.548559_3_plen_69_part_00